MADGDTSLLVRARAGDPRALDEIIAGHLPGLRGFLGERAGNLLRARESISDLAQSACREVLEDLVRRPELDPESLKGWLYQAALRKLVDRARYHGAEKRDAAREVPLDGAGNGGSVVAGRLRDSLGDVLSPSQLAMRREDVRMLETALARLPRAHRDVIILTRILALPHAEVARELGRSEGAVRALLFRALAALREEMDRIGAGP